mmetsp:Transcript_13361/g.32136  ORF Transcript_13361/g.32136 Transcript_13361/m.32136 type:complete len:88 (+) Transcript_13361:1986-2249(+)
MISCIVQAEEEDCDRWWIEIIQPAIGKGKMESSIKAQKETKTNHRDGTQELKKRKKLGKRKRPFEKVPKQKVEDSSAAAAAAAARRP